MVTATDDLADRTRQRHRAPRPEPRRSRARPAEIDHPSGTRPVRILWPYAVGLTLVHLGALLAVWPWFFSLTGALAALAGLYVFGTLGINLCFHRLLTHQGLRLPKWLERTFATLGVCSLQDAPGRWVAIHRLHHQHSDEQPDPHSPLVDFLWGHVGWLLVENRQLSTAAMLDRYARDVLRDPYYLFLERRQAWWWIYLIHAALFYLVGTAVGWLAWGTLALGVQFGASLVVWGVLVRTVAVWHITWSVNSLAHLWGYRSYETGENSRNNWLVALISNGEGWHNNHHADQRSAAHGHRWWELDVTWITIRLLAAIGVAKDVVLPRYRRDSAAS